VGGGLYFWTTHWTRIYSLVISPIVAKERRGRIVLACKGIIFLLNGWVNRATGTRKRRGKCSPQALTAAANKIFVVAIDKIFVVEIATHHIELDSKIATNIGTK
jgi:hypothetical protein